MTDSAEQEAALDRCIDRLLQGDEWQTTLPEEKPDREEVSKLMAIAQRLLALARTLPPLDAGQRERVWTRARQTVGRIFSLWARPSYQGGSPP